MKIIVGVEGQLMSRIGDMDFCQKLPPSSLKAKMSPFWPHRSFLTPPPPPPLPLKRSELCPLATTKLASNVWRYVWWETSQ